MQCMSADYHAVTRGFSPPHQSLSAAAVMHPPLRHPLPLWGSAHRCQFLTLPASSTGNRNAASLEALLRHLLRRISDPRHSHQLVAVAHRLLDIYGGVVSE